MGDPSYMSARELVAAIGQQTLRSEEVLDHYLERLDRFNGKINAVVATDVDAARARARAADAAAAKGESWGPLHGLPITVKDTFEVVGMPCTAGAPELKDHRPARHATAVERLIEAGAIVYGKTNTPLWAGTCRPTTPYTAPPTIRGTSAARRADRRADRRRRWRPVSRRWSLAPTSVAPSATRRISVASRGTSRASAWCRSGATSRDRRAR